MCADELPSDMVDWRHLQNNVHIDMDWKFPENRKFQWYSLLVLRESLISFDPDRTQIRCYPVCIFSYLLSLTNVGMTSTSWSAHHVFLDWYSRHRDFSSACGGTFVSSIDERMNFRSLSLWVVGGSSFSNWAKTMAHEIDWWCSPSRWPSPWVACCSNWSFSKSSLSSILRMSNCNSGKVDWIVHSDHDISSGVSLSTACFSYWSSSFHFISRIYCWIPFESCEISGWYCC